MLREARNDGEATRAEPICQRKSMEQLSAERQAKIKRLKKEKELENKFDVSKYSIMPLIKSLIIYDGFNP